MFVAVPMKKLVAAVAVATAAATTTTTTRHGPMAGVAAFCSAWTTTTGPGFRHPRRQYSEVRRDRRRLFSEAGPAASAVAGRYRDLFPPAETVVNGTLKTGEASPHVLYYEIHGSGPLVALFLHGGPGAGCFPNHARFFDPQKYTVVLLDQRGAGRSTPRGCTEGNTLSDLVEDCERLRRNLLPLRLDTHADGDACADHRPWDVVLGGSWGATLGLAYAQRYPAALRGLVLRGICALRPPEVDWLFSAGGGSALGLGEAWKNFSEAVVAPGGADAAFGDDDNDDGRSALHAYYDCLFNARNTANGTADNDLRLAAARSWMMWEMAATSSANQSNNNNQSTASPGGSEDLSNLTLVSSSDNDGGNWRFEDHNGEPMATHQSPESVASSLRKDIRDDAGGGKDRPLATGPRPVRPIDESIPLLAKTGNEEPPSNNNNNKTGGFRLPPDYVPAQAMLTCFYSVNDRFVMGNRNLLESNSDDPSSVKIIGIQGGRDPICPPDTAMDLLRSMQKSRNNNHMELRIPLGSGHSMYDPAIKHELVKATDRLAEEFLNQQ